MKTQDHIESYYKFVEEQNKHKQLTRLSIMLLLLDSVSNEMGKFGWERKGTGTVTETMSKTGIFKFDFVKVFNGEKVISTISININDDYDRTGFSQIIVKGSKPIQNSRWINKENSSLCFPEFDLTDTNRSVFFLENLLKNIDDTNV